MIVIPPFLLTTSNTTSTVAEPSPGEVVWNPATSYTAGQRAIRVETHRIYECQTAGVSATPPENDPTKWLDAGPTNKWAMFDNLRSLATWAPATMTITINPGRRVNSLALLGVKANKVTITMTYNGEVVYTTVRNMGARNTTTWSQYFFGEFKYVSSLLLQDLPSYANSVITIVFENDPALNVECSEIVVGNKIYLGAAQYEAVSDSLNFSRIERDEFGGSVLKQRRTVPKVNVTTWAHKALVNQIRDARNDLNAVPALWSGLDDEYEDPFYEAVLIYGIYKQFEINLNGPDLAIVNLELEEM